MAEKSQIFILKSGKCSWGKCKFCGYGKIIGREPDENAINREIDAFFDRIEKDVSKVKIFGSGSFLDTAQFPKNSQEHFVSKCKAVGIKDLVFESRPEFITKDALSVFKNIRYTVAIGLEVADNITLEKLNKGFTVEDYIRAAEIIKSAGGLVRTYLLVNPPFVKDIKSSLDFSVKFALRHSDQVVLINLYPHLKAELMDDYLSLRWKPLSRAEFENITSGWKNDKKVELDFENFSFQPKIPDDKREDLTGVGEKYLTHPLYEIWQDYFQRFYTPPKVKEYLLLLPCAFRKPYSDSKTHRDILSYLMKLPQYPKIHQVMVSSPGVIPREFENTYPFNAYDWEEWKETEDIKKRYIEVTAERVERYLENHKKTYKKVFSYLKPSSESFAAVKIACSKLKIPLYSCISDETYKHIISKGKEKQVLSDRLALESFLKTLRKEAA